jgi:hypothetical protein
MERITRSIDYSRTDFCARVYEAPETMPRGHLGGGRGCCSPATRTLTAADPVGADWRLPSASKVTCD